MSQPSSPPAQTDDDLETALEDLLAGLPDEDIEELAVLAEAMHATSDSEGGEN